MDSAASALAAAMSLTDRTPRTPLMRLKGFLPFHSPLCLLCAALETDVTSLLLARLLLTLVDASRLAVLLTSAPVQAL